MNDLTCNSICQLLCCPPLPSKIAAKLAFMPPPTSYQLSPSTDDDGEYIFSFAPFIKDSVVHFTPENLKVTKSRTRRGNTIVIMYMRTNPTSKLTFLLSHGNAVDLGLMVNFMHELGTKLNVNMMCYDYSGYGASTGKPLEKNLYADAECALDLLKTKFSVPLDQTVLYGQSIGTVPTVHLATLHRVAAVVLHSPLMSGLRVAFPRLKRNYCCDVFSNLARAPRIRSPTLVIHGTRDEVVHINHGYRICSALAENVLLDPLFIEGAGHNDCEMFPQYLLRLCKLVTVEIPRLRIKAGLEPMSHSPKSLRLGVRRTPSNRNSLMGDETDVSSSSSNRLSEEFQKGSPDSAKRSTPLSRASRNRISPLVAESLRALLQKRRVLTKRSTFSLSTNTGGADIVDDTSKNQRKHISSSETNISLLKSTHVHIPELVDVFDSVMMPLVALPAELDDTAAVQSRTLADIEVQPCDTLRNGDIQPESSLMNVDTPDQNEELDHLVLPPPPPPPPVSFLDDFPASRALLWSLHTNKLRKNLTLPRNLSPHQVLDSSLFKLKTETLPCGFRQFPRDCMNITENGEMVPLHATSHSPIQASLSNSTMSTSESNVHLLSEHNGPCAEGDGVVKHSDSVVENSTNDG